MFLGIIGESLIQQHSLSKCPPPNTHTHTHTYTWNSPERKPPVLLSDSLLTERADISPSRRVTGVGYILKVTTAFLIEGLGGP